MAVSNLYCHFIWLIHILCLYILSFLKSICTSIAHFQCCIIVLTLICGEACYNSLLCTGMCCINLLTLNLWCKIFLPLSYAMFRLHLCYCHIGVNTAARYRSGVSDWQCLHDPRQCLHGPGSAYMGQAELGMQQFFHFTTTITQQCIKAFATSNKF